MKGIKFWLCLFCTTMLKTNTFAQYTCWYSSDDIEPCEPYSTGVLCKGNNVTDLNQFPKKPNSGTGYRPCGALFINNTFLIKINEDAFGDLSFAAIRLYDNIHLESIHRNAFKASADSGWFDQLIIKNSPKLVSPKDLFLMINMFQSATNVQLSGLGIAEIPDDAFSGNTKLQAIHITENSYLIKIGKYVIYNVPGLQIFWLTSNAINEISRDAFTIKVSVTTVPRIDLKYNELTDSSFNENWVNVPKNLSNTYDIILSNNEIRTLPEFSFKSILLSQSVRLEFIGNNIRCDCKVKWIKLIETDLLKQRYESILCANKLGKSIFSLNLEDFGIC